MAEPFQGVEPGVAGRWGEGHWGESHGNREEAADGTLAKCLTIDRDIYKAPLDWWSDGEDGINEDLIQCIPQ